MGCKLTGTLSAIGTLSAEVAIAQIESIYTEDYTGDYSIIPSINGQVLETAGMRLKDDLVISPIPTFAVSNISGTTFIIGE